MSHSGYILRRTMPDHTRGNTVACLVPEHTRTVSETAPCRVNPVAFYVRMALDHPHRHVRTKAHGMA